jgi:CheY-like chemotaxis protein/anti-sigma regulatory factor (Ser/Thr protein kinase)
VGKLYADTERLQQIVWNLLSNAIKFTTQKGHVSLAAKRDGDALTVRVEDDGQGIGPDFLPHVFEPFRQADGSTTRRHGGLGLGLAIVKQLVQAHGGTVTAESRGAGLGSVFTVRLPVRKALRVTAQSGEQPAARLAEGRLIGIDVLVVDDDDDARALLKHVLETHGARVTAASSAEDALASFDVRTPDVILSDLSMPNVDGYGLIRRVRERPADRGGKTPVIAVTAHAKGPLTDGIFEAGFHAHVTKPIDPAQLVFLVANVTGLV